MTATVERSDSTLHQEERLPQGSRISDAALLERVLCDDSIAQEEFVRRFGRLIYALLHRMRLPLGVCVEDVYQQVFAHLWENNCQRLRSWRSEGKFSAYLGVIVIRLARRYGRTVEVLSEYTAEGVAPDAGQEILQKERQDFMRDALQRLNPRDRQILLLRYDRELSYKEIAKEIGITVNHVGVVLARAEARLGKILKEAGYDE